MKYIFIPFMLFWIGIFQESKAQALEFGPGFNITHLWQGNTYIDGVSKKYFAGVSLMARTQSKAKIFPLRHLQAGLEYTQAGITIDEHRSPGGAGGEFLTVRYKVLSATFNDYLINFNTLDKPFQIGLGIHFNYKLITQSNGYYTTQKIGWDSAQNYYSFKWEKHSLDGRNISEFEKLNIGLCMSVGFAPRNIGKYNYRMRIETYAAIGSEVNNAMGFAYISPRLTLNIVIPDKMNSSEKKRLEKRKEIKLERLEKKEERMERIKSKVNILDKSLEYGIGANLYHFLVNRGMMGNHTGLGFGFGMRIWDLKIKNHKLPGVSINFQQINHTLENGFFLIDNLTGKFQRNTISIGLYPVKFLILQKRIDVRLGFDFAYLLWNKAEGVYQGYDNISGKILPAIYFKKDDLNLNNKFTVSGIATVSGPILRRQDYCIKWRYTNAYSLADMTLEGKWCSGSRHQFEFTLCKKLPWNK
ncbi:MAG: hypothetical protein KG003_06035 [Bacteroidetes bacterium]|nr:hypothetical protein [Bacteroidota bacterium]